ncbi:hypothetical protein UAJ10_12490 [Nitrospirillum sp. BR 11164]|uniref:hypothetical protein n=1 Tax=Nitrospirillum sp. BR 11164 TaxID=3104324 RepID=UPI002AFFCF87|nr:hypothetical protein [Nitrospirillum sp. BR 11164]MEA1649830.1 hypothetical protein [Nitrospirillum sp. BR 11164]
MGILIYEKHGRGGFVETCGHIARQIGDGKAPTGHRLTILNTLLVCQECYNVLGFETFSSLSQLPIQDIVVSTDGRMERFEAAYDALPGRSCVCAHCLAEIENGAKSVNE